MKYSASHVATTTLLLPVLHTFLFKQLDVFTQAACSGSSSLIPRQVTERWVEPGNEAMSLPLSSVDVSVCKLPII